MAPTAGMYVIYDKVNQVPMLLDEATYRKVEHIVTAGRPSLEGIDYQDARQKMRAPILDKTKLKASEVKPDDLIAVYDKVNAATMAIPRWAYEKVKHHYGEKAMAAAAAATAAVAAAAAAASVPLSTTNWKTEEELDSVLRKEHPILNYRPTAPQLGPPQKTPCAVGLVACGACGLRSLPTAEPTLIVPEAAKVVVPSEGPLAALRPPSSSVAKDSQQRSQTRKSVAFAEPLAAVKVVVVAAAVTEEGPEIFDKVNNCFMKVPREVYLKVKHFYKDDLTFLYDRVNDCPMKVPWSTYMKVKKFYGVGFVPEVAARPGDEDLFVNIEDRVNGGKMRVPWNIWLKVRHHYKCTALPIQQVAQVAPAVPTLPAVPAASAVPAAPAAPCEGPEIFDKVNNCFMPVPREIYLKVKHHYKDDETYLYDRVNDCPMKVPWSTYMKVKKLYGVGFVPEVAARPGDEDLFVNIEDRVNGGKMRVHWNIWLKVRHYYDATPLPAQEEAPAAPWDGPEIFDKVNKCFMPVPREIYLKVKHHYKNDETYLYDRVNNCPMKVSWSTYMKVKKYYAWDSGEFVPEVAAHPGDDTLYLNIKDRVNGGKMRVPWKIWLQVRRWYLVDIWDRVNCTWMTVPREVYLKVKHCYDKDTTFLYDRVNDCPMQVSWHNYCEVRKYYTDISVDAWPGDSTLMISIPDRVNYTTMRVPWHHYRRMNYMLRLWEDNEPRTWIWDKVNLCPMEIKWKHYLKVAHHYGYTVAARQGDTELFTWIWDRVNQNYMRVPWRVMEKVKHYYANDETFIWDKVNKCEMKVPWNVFMEVRHHYGFTIDSRPGDEQLHHPIWDRVNNCWMRVPRPIYLKVKKYYAESFTFIFDRVNQCPMKVSWPNFMKVHHYYLDFYPRLACRPGDETLFVFIHDKVNLCKMRVSWENYLKVRKYVEIPKYFAFGAKK